MIGCGNRYAALFYSLHLNTDELHRDPVSRLTVYELMGNYFHLLNSVFIETLSNKASFPGKEELCN
jgi:hypothetical protein